MNFRAMIDELFIIHNEPNNTHVDVNVNGTDIHYRFSAPLGSLPAFYYPRGIAGITICRNGAGVVYVYTTNSNYPHLTIPDSGTDLHWTDVLRNRFYASETWPPEIRAFVGLYE